MSIVNVYHGAERLDTSSGKFYIERDGSMVEFSPKVRPEVWDSETLAYIASVQSVVKTDTLSVNATFPETQAVSVATLPLPESAATSAKQLADNHQVTVSNIASTPVITGFATEDKQDDIIERLPINDVGRLKTSNLPADITTVTGTITANAQTIPVSTDRVSNVMAHCYGTFSTINCTFEGSLNSTTGTDGNWFTIQAARTSTNTVETTTGNLSASPAYGWELSVNALRYMRVRATAYTSGTQNWVFTLGSYATEPIPAIQTHAVTIGSASTSIGKAEDGASASGNVGVPPMIVRADTLQANAGVSANGDYAFMFCDVDGRVYTTAKITESALPTGASTSANQGYIRDEVGTLFGVRNSSGYIQTISASFGDAIACGLFPTRTPWSKIGYNGDVDAGTEDMIGQGGIYVFPAAEGSMDIVSSSVEDDPDKGSAVAGTGIHTVTLYYLDDEFTEKSVDITLNGTVAVETSVSDIYRVQNMRAKVCGTGGAAAGNITLSEHGGATYKYGHILTGNIRMRQCVYTVPKNKVLYIAGISFAVGGATKEKSAVFTTLAKYDNKALATRTFFLPYNEVIIEDSAYHRELEIPTKLPAGVDLKVQVRGLVADCVCTCSLRGWME